MWEDPKETEKKGGGEREREKEERDIEIERLRDWDWDSEIFNETFPFGLADFHFVSKSPCPVERDWKIILGLWPGLELNPDATLEPQDLESFVIALQKSWEMLIKVHIILILSKVLFVGHCL